jgi:lactose/L-arabinose transport system ATP-binding protein
MADLVLRDIVKSYGAVRVIHGINLDIADNEFVVFVGPSGCGKSTLLRIIAGLEDIDEGTVSIGSRDVTDLEPVDRGIAMVFQSYALYPHMTVEENLAFGLKVSRVPQNEITERVIAAARSLQLEPFLKRKPAQLSGGQRQRVAIGRAITRNPQVFLFDEPLSNLDAELRVHMRLEIAHLHNRIGATMVYVTHDQVEAMTLADRIVVMQNGKVEQVGTPIELFDDPDNIFVAGFIGSPKMNFLSAKVAGLDDGKIEISLEGSDGPRITIPVTNSRQIVGADVTLGIRPEHISLVSFGPGSVTIRAQADVAEQLGDMGYLHSVTRNGSHITIEVRDRNFPRPDEQIPLFLNIDRACLFDRDGQRIR